MEDSQKSFGPEVSVTLWQATHIKFVSAVMNSRNWVGKINISLYAPDPDTPKSALLFQGG